MSLFLSKNDAKRINSNKQKCLQLKLRDTFRFVIYHDLKNVKQTKIIFQS